MSESKIIVKSLPALCAPEDAQSPASAAPEVVPTNGAVEQLSDMYLFTEADQSLTWDALVYSYADGVIVGDSGEILSGVYCGRDAQLDTSLDDFNFVSLYDSAKANEGTARRNVWIREMAAALATPMRFLLRSARSTAPGTNQGVLAHPPAVANPILATPSPTPTFVPRSKAISTLGINPNLSNIIKKDEEEEELALNPPRCSCEALSNNTEDDESHYQEPSSDIKTDYSWSSIKYDAVNAKAVWAPEGTVWAVFKNQVTRHSLVKLTKYSEDCQTDLYFGEFSTTRPQLSDAGILGVVVCDAELCDTSQENYPYRALVMIDGPVKILCKQPVDGANAAIIGADGWLSANGEELVAGEVYFPVFGWEKHTCTDGSNYEVIDTALPVRVYTAGGSTIRLVRITSVPAIGYGAGLAKVITAFAEDGSMTLEETEIPVIIPRL